MMNQINSYCLKVKKIQCPSLITKWSKFLVHTNHKPETYDHLEDYFFTEFSENTAYFFEFLKSLEFFFSSNKIHLGKKEIAKKYLQIISPLCEKFNFYSKKAVLDDICFKITNPNEYRSIDKLFTKYKFQSKKIIKKILENIKTLLYSRNIKFEIKGRYKNIYSIHKKLQKKSKKNALSLNDIFAFRIVIDEKNPQKCFDIANLLHDKYQPITEFFKDYISIPKINGYQSLHTGLSEVISGLDLPIEVQIRTKQMDEFAEKGAAAHWQYAKDKKSKSQINPSVQRNDHGENNYLYCLTYKGDIVVLPTNSTVLDFAYEIHSELGNKATCAIINGNKEDLGYIIKDGDMIKILESEKIEITSSRLKYCNNKSTKKIISVYLKHHSPKINAK